MNVIRSTRAILLFAVLSSLIAACGEEEEAEVDTPAASASPGEATAEAEPAEADEPAPAEADEGGGSGDVCERARACCSAYIDAVSANTPGVSAETACAGVQNATGPGADTTCQAAIDGWRQSLEALGTDVPSSCE